MTALSRVTLASAGLFCQYIVLTMFRVASRNHGQTSTRQKLNAPALPAEAQKHPRSYSSDRATRPTTSRPLYDYDTTLRLFQFVAAESQHLTVSRRVAIRTRRRGAPSPKASDPT